MLYCCATLQHPTQCVRDPLGRALLNRPSQLRDEQQCDELTRCRPLVTPLGGSIRPDFRPPTGHQKFFGAFREARATIDSTESHGITSDEALAAVRPSLEDRDGSRGWAGRGAANNADYRDLVRASLMVDVDYLILAMMLEYRSGHQVTRSYEQTKRRLNAIYASDRLKLPLKGILLVGY